MWDPQELGVVRLGKMGFLFKSGLSCLEQSNAKQPSQFVKIVAIIILRKIPEKIFCDDQTPALTQAKIEINSDHEKIT